MTRRYRSLWLLIFAFFAALPNARPQSGSGAVLTGDPFAETTVFQDLEIARDKDPFGIDVHGYLESRNRLRTGADNKIISTRQRVWMEADAKISPHLRFFASGALDADPAAAGLSDDHKVLRVHAEEVFLTIDTDRLDLVLGRKILRWGTGDGVNPLDLINPLDYQDPVASGRADIRVPVLLGQTIIRLPTCRSLQEAFFEGVVVPLARVNQLNAPGSAWESQSLKTLRDAHAQGNLVLRDQEKPDKYFENAEIALRLAVTFSGWDLSLIGFSGYTDDPVFARERVSSPGEKEMFRQTPVHLPFCAFGINFAKGLDRSTFRGELALKPDLPMMLADQTAIPGYVRRPVLQGVMGVDRTFGTNLYTNLQYFCTYVCDAKDLSGNRYDHGVTYDIHDLFRQDDLEAGIRGMVSLSNQGFTCEPYAELSLGDNWLLAVSLFFFGGNKNGAYGQFNDNDMLTFRLRYNF